MGKPQPAQLIALVFYGFFFFHGAEGRAESHRAFSKPTQHCIYQAGTKGLPVCSVRGPSANSEIGKLLAGPSFQLRLSPLFGAARDQLAAFRDFPLVGAKDFAIRTGLSPPR